MQAWINVSIQMKLQTQAAPSYLLIKTSGERVLLKIIYANAITVTILELFLYEENDGVSK